VTEITQELINGKRQMRAMSQPTAVY